jgi:hypothetical protein
MSSPDTVINNDAVVSVKDIPSTLECSKCNRNLSKNMFSKKGLVNKTCNKCHQISEQKLLSDLKNCMFSYHSSTPITSASNDRSKGRDGRTSGFNRNSNINLKHESEIIQKDSSKFVAGELPIRNELKNVGTGRFRHPVNGRGLMVLDLHKTADLFLKNQNTLAKLAEFRENFGLVVILSFVGKTDGPGSTRYQARGDIQHLISIGVADFGLLVFQRGPAKGWMCDTLSQVFSRGIYFSDDSDDHLESVKASVSKLLSIHQSDPTKPLDLFNWIQNCSQQT